MKICSKCKDAKSFSEFDIDRSKPDGHRARCKPCERLARRSRVRSAPEKPKQRQRKPKLAIPKETDNRQAPLLPCDPGSDEMKMRAAAAASAIGYY